ncbi:MAG: hypothetical protein CVT86_08275, partial [Alphaproteobacteria bacterium HGW-Alphaproteobacteria-8]
ARRFHIYDSMPPHLSYALGAGETTLHQMVAGYAMFANGGRRIEPTLIDRVQDRHGETIWRHDASICIGCAAPYDPAGAPTPLETGEQALDPVTAYQIVSMLRGVVTRGTASRPFAGVEAMVAGKTGTTNDAKDVWFLGFTPTMAFGCYIGFDQPRNLGRSAFGGTLCAPMVADFVKKATAGQAPGVFAAPPETVFVTINRWNGKPTGGAPGGDAIAEAFRPGFTPYDVVASDMIGGGALGAFVVGNNAKALKATFKAIPSTLKGSRFTKSLYMDLLSLLYEILGKIRKDGMMSIENDVENPEDSALFAKYPKVLADKHLVEFITDYLRLMVSGNMDAFQIENLMDNEIETHHMEGHV